MAIMLREAQFLHGYDALLVFVVNSAIQYSFLILYAIHTWSVVLAYHDLCLVRTSQLLLTGEVVVTRCF